MKSRKSFYLAVVVLLLALALAACGDNTATPAPPATTAPTTAQTATTQPQTGVASTTAPSTAGKTATTNPVTTTQPATAQPATTKATSGTGAPIRQTNWLEVFKNDPKLNYQPTNPPLDLPYIEVKEKSETGGSPILDSIVYLDMDGDGVEEAAIPLATGGTAGVMTFLVYRQASPVPVLAAWGGGYKLSLLVENKKLVGRSALYSGWEPNCCPSGFIYETYTLKGDKLSVVSERKEGIPEARQGTVTHFYDLINNGQLEDAYKLLSPRYQSANPKAAWLKGYATTKKVEAEVSDEPDGSGLVRVYLTSTDSTPSGDVTKKFAGNWKLVYDQQANGWLLDTPNIKEQAAGAPKATIYPALQPLLANLKKQTKVAVYLPSDIPNPDGTKIYAALTKADASGYSIELGLSQECRGETACRLGGIYVETNNGNDSGNLDHPVELINNNVGNFVASSCGASCSDATLTWTQDGVNYTVSLKSGKQDELVKMANSMIANGKL